ncbi:hypothetical protein ASPFODRAFT_80875 [Aspergillus luchuensis CBS 106.47]|uniref:Uncharacterized protein n=1 Tax=Aspergillus luchuensis (strain CBS 106.47) TaxID=1137211 RepID=A0A1M3TI36_ASPLC|nr:hypothetical protein ASPFODRAFT_80875 [Aspergillus luchuensis CBS 106.47]
MFVDRCGALGSYTKSLVVRRYSIGCKSCASSVVKLTLRSGTCRDAFCTAELVFNNTNADRIIEALDKHTGENCHDVIARPGGVSGFHLTRHFHLLRRPFIGKLSRAVYCAACFPAHPGQHSADSLDAADIGFPANGNSSSWSDLEHNRGNNTSRDEDLDERRTDRIW